MFSVAFGGMPVVAVAPWPTLASQHMAAVGAGACSRTAAGRARRFADIPSCTDCGMGRTNKTKGAPAPSCSCSPDSLQHCLAAQSALVFEGLLLKNLKSKPEEPPAPRARDSRHLHFTCDILVPHCYVRCSAGTPPPYGARTAAHCALLRALRLHGASQQQLAPPWPMAPAVVTCVGEVSLILDMNRKQIAKRTSLPDSHFR